VQQTILDAFPSTVLRVYVVWQPLHVDDSIDKARQSAREIFHDERVRHLWDGENALGKWYKSEGRMASEFIVVWDAYYLYAAESVWRTAPSHLIGLGHPVIDTFSALKEIVATLPVQSRTP
jgi:hypothetical protein